MSPDPDARHVIEVHDCPACHMRPGSDTARAKGCVCPVMDNGRGHNPYRLIVSEGCAVHCPPPTPEAGEA